MSKLGLPAFAVVCLVCSTIWAQVEDDPAPIVQPDSVVSPMDESDPFVPEAGFTIPETVVIGRPDSFPSQPLGEDQLLTAGRGVTLQSQFGGSVTVIDRQQIERTRQRSVGEILRHTVGLDVTRTGGPGGPTSVFLRGGNSGHTKVLIDGSPVNDPSSANRLFDFSKLSTDNLERIEVLRGPQSMVYGSDALGGVINIITRRGEGPMRGSSQTEGGTLGSWTQALSVRGGDEQRYYSLNGSFHHTDGVTSAAVRLGNSERDRFRQGNVTGRFGWNPNENLNIDYSFRFVDGETEVDDFGVDHLDRLVFGNQFFNRIQIQSWHVDRLITQKIGFSLNDSFRRDTHPEPFFGVPRFDGQSRQLDWQVQLQLFCWNTLVAGVDYYHEDASSTFNAQRGQFNRGAYIEDRFQFGERWFNTIGFRWDNHSVVDDSSTYRYTTRYEIYETCSAIHGSIGTGFRAPSLAEKLFPGGNTLLNPETNKGWDVGLRQQLTEDLWIDATYFRSDYDNLIEFDFATFMSQNIGAARATGVELSSGWRLHDATSVSINYTFNENRDLAFGGTLPRRPQQKGSVSVSRPILDGRGEVSFYALYVGHRLDFAQRFGGTRLDDYWLLNLSTTYDLNDCWQFYARLDNLLDEDYEEAGGFDTPGISGVAGFIVEL
jgi:vitamin B12 transporter